MWPGLRKVVRLSFAKVAEYQRRGVVHLHAVIRLDAVGDGDTAALCTTATLTAAIRLAAAKGQRTASGWLLAGSARWGEQVDVKTVTDSPITAASTRSRPAHGRWPTTWPSTPPSRPMMPVRSTGDSVALRTSTSVVSPVICADWSRRPGSWVNALTSPDSGLGHTPSASGVTG
jgi:hypothetical protein